MNTKELHGPSQKLWNSEFSWWGPKAWWVNVARWEYLMLWPRLLTSRKYTWTTLQNYKCKCSKSMLKSKNNRQNHLCVFTSAQSWGWILALSYSIDRSKRFKGGNSAKDKHRYCISFMEHPDLSMILVVNIMALGHNGERLGKGCLSWVAGVRQKKCFILHFPFECKHINSYGIVHSRAYIKCP